MDPDQLYNSFDKNLYANTGLSDNTNSAASLLTPASSSNSTPGIPADQIMSGTSTATTYQATGGATQQGKTTYDNTVAGYILGFDPVSGVAKFYIGNSTNYLNWNGTTLTISGSISASSIDIPDKVTADSFHVDSTGNVWVGATTFATAPFTLSNTGNIVVNSLRRKDFHWFTIFESIDGYAQTITGAGGTVVGAPSTVKITTGGSGGNKVELSKNALSFSSGFTWNKNRSLSIILQFANTTNQQVSLGIGYVLPNGSGLLQQMGFYVTDNTIKGTVGDGTGRTDSTSTTIAANTTYLLTLIYVAATSVSFYINNVLLGTVTTNIPSGLTYADQIFDVVITTNENATKSVNIGSWDFWQSN